MQQHEQSPQSIHGVPAGFVVDMMEEDGFMLTGCCYCLIEFQVLREAGGQGLSFRLFGASVPCTIR